MSFIAKLADKVTKPIGHLGTDTLKVKVVLSITAITMACSKTVCVKPQLQRGDQKAIDLKLVQIQQQEMRVNKIPSGMETNVDSSIFVKNGVPQPKTCMVRFFKTDKSGGSQVLVAEYEINLAMHFGDQFAEQVYDLPRVGNDPDLNVQSVKVKALLSCAKAKEADTNLLQTCVEWRQQQGPPSQSAIPVVSRRQTQKQPAAAAATADQFQPNAEAGRDSHRPTEVQKPKSLASSIAAQALQNQQQQDNPEESKQINTLAAASNIAESPRERVDSGEQRKKDEAAKAALIDEEVKNRVQTALQELRDEKQPQIDQQQQQIAEQRRALEDLQQRKKEMEDLLAQNVAVEPGSEQKYIHEQRLKIKELYDQLNAEKVRKNELRDKLKAYNEIKQRLAEKDGDKEENLQELMTEYQTKKTQMQEHMDKNVTVQLYKRAYEIEEDAY